MNKEQLYMVFDVESVGLHGEGFAVGFVVVNGYGVEIQSGLAACPPDRARGTNEDRVWIKDNIPAIPENCDVPFQVRAHFWQQWMDWKQKGVILVTDCGWPVEARFLAQCVDDDRRRKWEGPYPLHDLASILLAAGKNPTATFDRLPNELPAHNPLNDARQSARILIENLK